MTLSAEKTEAAISYKRKRLVHGLPLFPRAIGLALEGGIDAEFVQAVATWQGAFFGNRTQEIGGKVGPVHYLGRLLISQTAL